MSEKTTKPLRIIPGWLSWWWGVPGNGFGLQSHARFWGLGWRMGLIGYVHVKDQNDA